MLQVIRDRAQGFFAWLIVGAIILSFALWGINEYFRDDTAGMKVATVAGKDISVYEYQIAFNNERARMEQMFGENFDSDMFDQQIKTSALDRVVDNAVLTSAALDAGMVVSDGQLFTTLQQIEAFQEDGKFSKTAYEMALRQSGEPTSSFEARIRRALLADQIVKGIAATGFATSSAVKATLKLQNQERELSYIRIKSEDFKKSVNVSDDDVKAHYDANSETYKTPEQVMLDYLELSVQDLVGGIEVSDEEIDEYYDDQKDRFSAPEERKARHILIEGSSNESKAKAEEIYQKAVAGEDFAKLAKAHSADPGSASDGGMLDFFGKGLMDPEFEKSAFSLKKGEISKPVLSSFGYHVIKLEDVRGGAVKPLAEVKNEITADIKRQKAEKEYFDKVEKLSNLTYELPDSLDEARDKLGLQIKSTPFFGRGGGPGAIASNRKVIDAAFGEDVMRERLNSPMIELSEQHAVVIRLKEYRPAEVRPLDQVRTRIENELKNERAKKMAEETGNKALEKLNSGSDIESVANAEKQKAEKRAWVKRNDSTLGPEISREVFSAARPANGATTNKGFSLANGDFVVMTLFAIKDGDEAADDNTKSDANNRIANSIGMDEFGFMLKSIKDEVEIQKFPGNL
ncbi:MAG: SurA N-terminal domain-containing protein [Gammaproteobacteria bacterium]|nr:SurA N-terminal domain-containing protein [Gammaproteobacteria bacterium]